MIPVLKKHIPFILVIFLAMIFFACQKEEIPSVAKVGDLQVTVEEFELAYKFNPQLSGIKSPAAAKHSALLSLIAEKLLATEGYQKGYGENQLIKQSAEQYEREALIESLWREVILKDMRISDTEIDKAYQRSKTKRIFRYLSFPDQVNARNVWQQLAQGFSLEQIAAGFGIKASSIPTDTISFGSKIPAIEDTVFSMHINELSGPVKLGDRYYIIKLEKELTNIFSGKVDKEEQEKSLIKELKQRKSIKLFSKFVKQEIKEKYEIDKSVFTQLARRMQSKLSFGDNNDPEKLEALFSEINKKPDEFINQPMIKFPGNENWTVSEFLKRLRISPYPIDISNSLKFKQSIILATKSLLDDELLVRKAKSIGLQSSPSVLTQTKMWRENLVEQKIMRDLAKSWYKEHGDGDGFDQFIEEHLIELYDRVGVKIDFEKINQLTNERTDMVVYKSHFPGRTISPLLDNLDQFSKLSARIK